MKIVKKREVAIVNKEEWDILNQALELLGGIYYESEEEGDLESMAHTTMDNLREIMQNGSIECEKG